MPKILLVDDEPSILSGLRRTIRFMPADTFDDLVVIETFDKPESALIRAAECAFDLVISDWRMPVMNGIAFLGKLVQIQPEIARLILSGYGEFLSEADAIKRIGVFHFIGKPWNNDDLKTLICSALENRRRKICVRGDADAEYLRCTLPAEYPSDRSTCSFAFVDRIQLQS